MLEEAILKWGAFEGARQGLSAGEMGKNKAPADELLLHWRVNQECLWRRVSFFSVFEVKWSRWEVSEWLKRGADEATSQVLSHFQTQHLDSISGRHW